MTACDNSMSVVSSQNSVGSKKFGKDKLQVS